MNSGRIMNLLVTIPAESRRMNVGKDVIRVLGSPAYATGVGLTRRAMIRYSPCNIVSSAGAADARPRAARRRTLPAKQRPPLAVQARLIVVVQRIKLDFGAAFHQADVSVADG